MLFKPLAFVALASSVASQSLTQVLVNQSSLSNLTTYLGAFPTFVQTVTGLSNITLLAPNNDAFTKLLATDPSFSFNDTSLITAFFSYHVLQGTYANFSAMPAFVPSLLQPGMYANVTGGQVVELIATGNQSAVAFSGYHLNSTTVNNTINFTGGVIHIIDSFLTLPANVSTTAVAANLTSVVGAIEALNLTDVIDTTPDITVFAPDNAAFQAIGSALGNASTDTLTSILKYHVVAGTVGYSSLLSNTTLTTLQGASLTVEVINGSVFINNARVLVPDVLVSNGVVHVIDNVLNPLNTTATANPTATAPATPAFSGASSASNVPFTSGVPQPTVGTTAATSAATVSSTAGAAGPVRTAAIGMGALFGGAAVVMNL